MSESGSSVADGSGTPSGSSLACDSPLLFDAMRHLATSAPQGWSLLLGEFDGVSLRVYAVVDSASQWVAVPPAATEMLRAYWAQLAAADQAKRMSFRCDAQGVLTASFSDVSRRVAEAEVGGSGEAAPGNSRWGLRATAVLAVLCLVSSGVLGLLALRGRYAPAADLIPVSVPTARQLQAQDVVARWYQAISSTDIPKMESLVCGRPDGFVASIMGMARAEGQLRSSGVLTFDAFVEFVDSGDKAETTTAFRFEPNAPEVEAGLQKKGPAYLDEWTLIRQGDDWRVCGGRNGSRRYHGEMK
ncbi:hypothetical protein [Mycobacteroides chelonae]|uniref:hypothetical protein n=1 Tax=Mycobacteroides chelonae TaxID=1774 RepID=UPI0012FFD127|nr:hypothetical protein [Mycobacteroides chelonae]